MVVISCPYVPIIRDAALVKKLSEDFTVLVAHLLWVHVKLCSFLLYFQTVLICADRKQDLISF